jgi:hypothetical protein
MKWSREEYIELMTFGKIERQMFTELFGPLVGLEDEWLAQGATREEIDMVGFDWDYVPVTDCGGNTGLMHPLKPKVLEETSHHIIRTNEYGKREKLCKGAASIFHPIEYPVKNMDDWMKISPSINFLRSGLIGIKLPLQRKSKPMEC